MFLYSTPRSETGSINGCATRRELYTRSRRLPAAGAARLPWVLVMQPAYLQILRDSLLLSPRLVGAALEVWLGRLVAPANRLRKFTSVDWLSEQLNVDPRLIAGATIEEVHTGTASRSRLYIRYAEPLQGLPGPVSLFVKSTPPDFGSSLFGVLLDLGGNEVSFYRHIRPDLQVKSPRVFYCEGDSRNYVMLLEDLGDQDCDFRDLASKCSLGEATSVVTTLAELHAAFWQSERFERDLAWVKRFETNRDFRLLNLVRQLSVTVALEKYGHVLPARIRDVVPHLLDN